MNLDYATPPVPAEWAESRKTHPAVAMAIHAIADSTRSPEAIWEAPTKAERSHVATAVDQYLKAGLFKPARDGHYQWGKAAIDIPT